MATRKFDLFISHASEDKVELVYPLATALTAAGLNVWYDEFSLRLGDNLRQAIDKGLAQSRYGVVVLSKAFFGKQWPQWEMDGLLQRQLEGRKVILPVWHGVKAADVKQYSLSLANLKGVSTDDGLGPVIARILDVVAPDVDANPPTSRKIPDESTTAAPDVGSVSRLAMPIRRIEPYYLEFATALESSADAPAQSLLRKHPEMLFQISSGRGSFVRTNFQLGQAGLFDAIQLRDLQVIQATLVTLAPVSEPPFHASGTWSSSLATAAGRIAAASRWITSNRDRFRGSVMEVIKTETGSSWFLDRVRDLLKLEAMPIRPHFLILAGRRASINEDSRQRFHESFREATLLSYDSILHSLVREEFYFDLAKPVLVKTVSIKPGEELAVSINSWPLDEVLDGLKESLKPLPADARREITAVEVALAGEFEPPPTEHRYCYKPGDIDRMRLCVRGDIDNWSHPAHWSEWIYSQPHHSGNRSFEDLFRIHCKAPRLRVPQTLQLVIKSVQYKEHRPELQEWERDGEQEDDLWP